MIALFGTTLDLVGASRPRLVEGADLVTVTLGASSQKTFDDTSSEASLGFFSGIGVSGAYGEEAENNRLEELHDTFGRNYELEGLSCKLEFLAGDVQSCPVMTKVSLVTTAINGHIH